MTGHRHRVTVTVAAVTLVLCGLAVVGAWAWAQADKHAQTAAAFIAIPAAIVFAVVLAWLFSRGRNGGTP